MRFINCPWSLNFVSHLSEFLYQYLERFSELALHVQYLLLSLSQYIPYWSPCFLEKLWDILLCFLLIGSNLLPNSYKRDQTYLLKDVLSMLVWIVKHQSEHFCSYIKVYRFQLSHRLWVFFICVMIILKTKVTNSDKLRRASSIRREEVYFNTWRYHMFMGK